jgi:hypothetical protein
VIAEYDCPTHEDGITIYQEMIDEVKARHPGQSFLVGVCITGRKENF